VGYVVERLAFPKLSFSIIVHLHTLIRSPLITHGCAKLRPYKFQLCRSFHTLEKMADRGQQLWKERTLRSNRFTKHVEHGVPVKLGNFENWGGRCLHDTQSLIRVPSILVTSMEVLRGMFMWVHNWLSWCTPAPVGGRGNSRAESRPHCCQT
jgi:hypothetical protein